jgi:hypothetical protein
VERGRERRVDAAREVGPPERDVDVGDDPRALEPPAVGPGEVGHRVHQHVARGQPPGVGEQRLPRRRLAEDARAPERLEPAGEDLGGAGRLAVDQHRHRPREGAHGAPVGRRAPRVGHEAQRGRAVAQGAERRGRVEQVPGDAGHHVGHTPRVAPQVEHEGVAAAQAVDGGVERGQDRREPHVEADDADPGAVGRAVRDRVDCRRCDMAARIALGSGYDVLGVPHAGAERREGAELHDRAGRRPADQPHAPVVVRVARPGARRPGARRAAAGGAAGDPHGHGGPGGAREEPVRRRRELVEGAAPSRRVGERQHTPQRGIEAVRPHAPDDVAGAQSSTRRRAARVTRQATTRPSATRSTRPASADRSCASPAAGPIATARTASAGMR